METELELVPIGVNQVDRANEFYSDRPGFSVDVDVQPVDGVRVVQVTLPGSACSIGFAAGLPIYDEMTPGVDHSDSSRGR